MLQKKAQVHMLPTNNSNFCVLTHIDDKDLKDASWLVRPNYDAFKYEKSHDTIIQPLYLYFTTDEEIKEGDYGLNLNSGSLFKVLKKHSDYYDVDFLTGGNVASTIIFADWSDAIPKKIVATTNPELWSTLKKIPFIQIGEVGIPKIGLDFVEAYVKAQDSIKEVMLEYEVRCPNGHIMISGDFCVYPHCNELLSEYIKLRPNGTVVIHPIQQIIYTRDEVIDIIAYRMADHRRSLEYHKTNKHMSALWKQLKEFAIHYLDNVYNKN